MSDQQEPWVDLNADLGEEVTDDEALLGVVTSANVACGYHAGDREIMRAVCAGAARRGVRLGAQVSYRDREGFGRRPMDVPEAVLAEQVSEQVSVLVEIAHVEGVQVTYVKPHGALYNRVVDDEEQAAAVLAGSGDLPVLGLPGGVLLRLADEVGRRVYTEGFPDRGYEPPDERGVHRLRPRGEPGAVLEDPEEIARHAVRLARQVHSVCVHGDGRDAVRAAHAVRRALTAAGLRLAAFT
jgi:5-oxoprolinase (ATP-hydrolysing) subunit A